MATFKLSGLVLLIFGMMLTAALAVSTSNLGNINANGNVSIYGALDVTGESTAVDNQTLNNITNSVAYNMSGTKIDPDSLIVYVSNGTLKLLNGANYSLDPELGKITFIGTRWRGWNATLDFSRFVSNNVSKGNANIFSNLTLGQKITFKLLGYWENMRSGWFDTNVGINTQGGVVATGEINTSDDIHAVGNITLGDIIAFRQLEEIDNIVDGWIRIKGSLNVTNNLQVNGYANISGYLNASNIDANGDIKAWDDLKAVDDAEIGGDILLNGGGSITTDDNGNITLSPQGTGNIQITSNTEMPEKNITAGWFKGRFNWTIISNWFTWDGASLGINTTAINTSLDERYVNVAGDSMTGNLNMTLKNITTISCILFASGGQICSN